MSRRRAYPGAGRSQAQRSRPAAGRGDGAAGGLEASGGRGGDLSPVAQSVRRDEGRRCQAAEGAGGREREVEADRGRSGVEYRGAVGGEPGKLLSPQRRRQAVWMLQDRLGLSERRACRYLGQARSTQRHEPAVAQDDAALRAELKAFSRQRPRWGYRQAISICWSRAGRSTASAPSGCGAKKACGCRRSVANVDAAGSRQCPGIGCEPSGLITCGRSTSSSMSPTTVVR